MPKVSRKPAAEQAGKMIAQSVTLPGDWSRERAQSWLEEHSYHTTIERGRQGAGAAGESEGESRRWRSRQFNPEDFEEGSFRTEELEGSGGVQLVLGRVRGGAADSFFRIDAARIDRFEMVGGRMRVDVFMSRTGVQEYDQGDGAVQREQRDASEVFAAESLASLRGMPVTVQHPRDTMVDGRNWRGLTHGLVGDEAGVACGKSLFGARGEHGGNQAASGCSGSSEILRSRRLLCRWPLRTCERCSRRTPRSSSRARMPPATSSAPAPASRISSAS